MGVDRGPAHQVLGELEVAERVQQRAGRGDDLGADPVAGQQRDPLRGHGRLRRDVQSHVVERQGTRNHLERGLQVGVAERPPGVGRGAAPGRRSRGSRGGPLGCTCRSSSQQRTRVEARPLQPHLRVARRGEVPGARDPAKVGGEALVAVDALDRVQELLDVADAAALRLQVARPAEAPSAGGRTGGGDRGSNGRWRWRRSRRPARPARARAGRRRSARPRRRATRAPWRSSTARRRRRSPGRAAGARAAAGSPARCRSPRRAPSRRRPARAGRSPRAPIPPAGRRPGRRSRRPSRVARRPAHREVVTGPRSPPPRGLEGRDRGLSLEGEADVVEPVQQAMLTCRFAYRSAQGLRLHPRRRFEVQTHLV